MSPPSESSRATQRLSPSEGQPPLGPDLDRHLVGGAAHAAGLDLQQRGGVAERALEDLDGLLPGGPGGLAQGVRVLGPDRGVLAELLPRRARAVDVRGADEQDDGIACLRPRDFHHVQGPERVHAEGLGGLVDGLGARGLRREVDDPVRLRFQDTSPDLLEVRHIERPVALEMAVEDFLMLDGAK